MRVTSSDAQRDCLAARPESHRRSSVASHRSPGNLFIGTSGWAYPSWKPRFYPQDVPSRAFLAFYASRLTSVEVNYTFRTLPFQPRSCRAGWTPRHPASASASRPRSALRTSSGCAIATQRLPSSSPRLNPPEPPASLAPCSSSYRPTSPQTTSAWPTFSKIPPLPQTPNCS